MRLCGWINMKSFPQHLGSPKPDIIIQSDATPRGWGFQIHNKWSRGSFDKSMNYSINVKELTAIWYALLVVTQKNVTIEVLCDNLSAIHVLRKGGSMTYHLYSLAELIWKRAAAFNWKLSISHIEGTFNVLADQLSRNTPLSTEWTLSSKDFQKILKLNSLIQVDLFATHHNNKLPEFVSPCPDPRSKGVNALVVPWDRWDHLYMYPPTPLISRVLNRMTQYSFKTAILVTPETPTRPWYMKLHLQGIPSTLIEVTLQQTVVDKVVVQTNPTQLRVWQLSERHTKQDFKAVNEQ